MREKHIVNLKSGRTEVGEHLKNQLLDLRTNFPNMKIQVHVLLPKLFKSASLNENVERVDFTFQLVRFVTTEKELEENDGCIFHVTQLPLFPLVSTVAVSRPLSFNSKLWVIFMLERDMEL